jgi:hypothetical protein
MAELLVPEELRRSTEAKTQAEILEDKSKNPNLRFVLVIESYSNPDL